MRKDWQRSSTQVITESAKWVTLLVLVITLLAVGLVLTPISELWPRLLTIIKEPDILIVDYIAIAGLGPALTNAGLVGLSNLILLRLNLIHISGPVVAALFTMIGFALFGKTVVSIWPVIIGVWFYARVRREPFRIYFIPAMFGTALAPIFSQVTFGFGKGVFLGFLAAALAGFILPPLASQLLRVHQGLNLYNIGFTAGFIGTMYASVFRAYGLVGERTITLSAGEHHWLVRALPIYLLAILALGLWWSSGEVAGQYRKLVSYSGALVTDLVDLVGFGAALINMAVVGLVGYLYVVIVRGDFNGPTIGAILTMVGFAAFGKHPLNIIPVIGGAFLGSLGHIWSVQEPSIVIAALFSTTLAPIAGTFGPVYGLIAGFFHVAVTNNVSYLHGGLNLYNNGFAGGIVATMMVVIIKALHPKYRDD
ncbi:MAG: DUF1576 domain-containing protein [Bacillota bacterium]